MDTDKPIPNPTAVLREEPDGWAVLINMDTGASVALNSTGVLVWRLMDGKRTVEDIVRAFKARFDFDSHPTTSDRVSDDVRSLLSMLAEEGFIGHGKPLMTIEE